MTTATEEIIEQTVEGEVIFFMPPPPLHQRVLAFVTKVVALYVKIFNLGEILFAPLEMRIHTGGAAREPDLLFLSHKNMGRIDNRRVNGPADLVVEIVSTESVSWDRGDKFYEYQEGGAPEYWIIDPRPGEERVDICTLIEQNRYQAILPDADRRYHFMALPGFWFREEMVP